jgi:hypothetical protein
MIHRDIKPDSFPLEAACRAAFPQAPDLQVPPSERAAESNSRTSASTMLHKFKMRRPLGGQLSVAKPRTATTDKWQQD